ncbi:hypothetical protein L484_002321 [Morus notabilis]|uniref:Prolamin-like domain-containing protein n=1 Tax=Morus notabilis TaxID=981085 RepID=W9RU13_9ROSA|nr:egg cell-secreted protein 1.1 [Morus notabilis]EXB71426.1 hypothetical protein L484_002321 [Morus notabilis]
MAYTTLINLFLFSTLLALASIPAVTMARPGASIPTTASVSNLAARLKLEEESSNCWDSLIQLQACTGEVILFFLNGETYLGPSCCEAIRTIGQHCWPAMFCSLGFTTEETDVLQGYCLGEARGSASSPPLPPPSPQSI